jgi:signal transduction histidine kinase
MDTTTISSLSDSLLNLMSEAVLIVDGENRVVAVNDLAAQLFGDGELPKTIDDLHHGDKLHEWLSQRQPTDWSPEPSMYLQVEVKPFHDDTGDYRAILLHDVSEKRQLAKSQHEFLRLVSHDLRSPLTSILGFAGMLEQGAAGELNEKQQYFTRKILSGIEQIVRLVENIQDAGRFDPETGFYEMNKAPTDIGEIVKRVVQHTVIPQVKTQLQLGVDIDVALPVIEADATMLERAITNLVDNAVKYTPDAGIVHVEAARDGDSIAIRVRDNGLGISREDQHKLFQRHSRIARQEFKNIKGSGLGLFIVRSVAQRHGGKAWVESTLGKGSTFVISLPLRRE